MVTFRCLDGLAPPYLADVCASVSSVVGRRQLRSADNGTLVGPRNRTTVGRRDFAVSGPSGDMGQPQPRRRTADFVAVVRLVREKLETH